MDIVISNASGKPIYEQITGQIKGMILSGVLLEGDALPSMRLLAKELRISVITTKRAYEELEREGFIETVMGKGSFVAGRNMELIREEQLRLYALLGVLLGALIYLLGPGSVVAWLGRRLHGKKHGENAPVQQENAHAKANHSIYNAEKQAYAPEKPPSPVAPASPKLPE